MSTTLTSRSWAGFALSTNATLNPYNFRIWSSSRTYFGVSQSPVNFWQKEPFRADKSIYAQRLGFRIETFGIESEEEGEIFTCFSLATSSSNSCNLLSPILDPVAARLHRGRSAKPKFWWAGCALQRPRWCAMRDLRIALVCAAAWLLALLSTPAMDVNNTHFWGVWHLELTSSHPNLQLVIENFLTNPQALDSFSNGHAQNEISSRGPDGTKQMRLHHEQRECLEESPLTLSPQTKSLKLSTLLS